MRAYLEIKIFPTNYRHLETLHQPRHLILVMTGTGKLILPCQRFSSGFSPREEHAHFPNPIPSSPDNISSKQESPKWISWDFVAPTRKTVAQNELWRGKLPRTTLPRRTLKDKYLQTSDEYLETRSSPSPNDELRYSDSRKSDPSEPTLGCSKWDLVIWS